MIDYLKKNKIGRMTFLPISKIKGKKISWNLEGVVASSVVQFDNQIKEIVESFLGRTILVGNMDLAIRLRNSDKQNLRFITLDGEVFNPIGSIVGGYSKSGKSSLINRKHSLDILKKELEDLEHRLMEKRRSFEETGKKLKLEKEKLSDLTDALENINVSIEKRKKEEDALNLKYALASSSPMRRINEMLALNNFEKIFDYKVTGEAFKVSKPNPEIFLNAVENLGFTVEECLVIEDTTNGVLAANRANIQVIGYRHTEYIADLSTANYCISNLLEAEEIVRNLRK